MDNELSKDLQELKLWREEAELASRPDAHIYAQKTIAMMRARIEMRMLAIDARLMLKLPNLAPAQYEPGSPMAQYCEGYNDAIKDIKHLNGLEG